MKLIIGLIALITVTHCLGQPVTSNQSMLAKEMDTSSSGIIFFEDFNNNKNNWTVADNKKESARIDAG